MLFNTFNFFIFDFQDYYNFVDQVNERPFFLPPIEPQYGYSTGSQLSSRYGSKEKVYLPKTFTTRKGALLLFSEDMAHKTRQTEAKRHRFHHGFHDDEQSPEDSMLSDTTVGKDLNTVDDLARCILSYGSQFGHVSTEITNVCIDTAKKKETKIQYWINYSLVKK